jgi:hypothetical protein
MFYTLRSSDPHRSRVIIDVQLSIARPEVEMALYGATYLKRYKGSIGCCGFFQ